jgi:hypothetical protein
MLIELFKDINLVAIAEKIVAKKRIISFTKIGILVAIGSRLLLTYKRKC